MKFHALEIFLLETWKTALRHKADLIVVIEAGWLNPVANYRKSYINRITGKQTYHSDRVKEKMAGDTGENHAVGKLLAEYCEEIGMPLKLFRPNPKTPKWNHIRLKMITGYSRRTNQEERDAVRAAWIS
jgi:hypothetical protein